MGGGGVPPMTPLVTPIIALVQHNVYRHIIGARKAGIDESTIQEITHCTY